MRALRAGDNFVRVRRLGKRSGAFGMVSALMAGARVGRFRRLSLEDTIRTLSVGLMALAALMVSFSVARQRSEPRRDEIQPPSGRADAASPVNLEALRSAGF